MDDKFFDYIIMPITIIICVYVVSLWFGQNFKDDEKKMSENITRTLETSADNCVYNPISADTCCTVCEVFKKNKQLEAENKKLRENYERYREYLVELSCYESWKDKECKHFNVEGLAREALLDGKHFLEVYKLKESEK